MGRVKLDSYYMEEDYAEEMISGLQILLIFNCGMANGQVGKSYGKPVEDMKCQVFDRGLLRSTGLFQR